MNFDMIRVIAKLATLAAKAGIAGAVIANSDKEKQQSPDASKTSVKAENPSAAAAGSGLVDPDNPLRKSLPPEYQGNYKPPKPAEIKPAEPIAPSGRSSSADFLNGLLGRASKVSVPNIQIVPHNVPAKNTAPPPSGTRAFSGSSSVPPKDSIYIPDTRDVETVKIPFVELTEEEAVKQGFSFRKKSKAVRITNYHGSEISLVIPSKIGGKRVNELSEGAFKNNRRVKRVYIPNSVVKAGGYLFYNSNIWEVYFGRGLRAVPKYAFSHCSGLRKVVLPSRVVTIEEHSFEDCRALEYIAFPKSLFLVEDHAFSRSGLKGFSTPHARRLGSGLAFKDTPLHRSYELIATLNDKYNLRVLLVGENAKIKFPKKNVVLEKNSICAKCELDLSECTGFDSKAAVFEDENHSFPVNVIARQGQEGFYFGKRGTVRYADGSVYPGLLIPVSKNSSAQLTAKFTGVAFRFQAIPSEYVHFGVKSLKITTKLFLSIYPRAFDDPELERLEMDCHFKARGEIFSEKCTALREVRWMNQDYVQYIPPVGAISERLHRELLKAFCESENGFFDGAVIDGLFREKAIRCSEFGETRRVKITQRERVFLAIDVLRSTHGYFTSVTEIYSRYLKNHLRYAKTVCENIKSEYPEYKEFLNRFTRYGYLMIDK